MTAPPDSMKILSLKGFVMDSVLDVKTISLLRPSPQRFSINYVTHSTPVISGWSLSRPGIVAEVLQARSEGDQHRLDITLNATSDLPLGPLDETLDLDVDVPSWGKRVWSIPVSGYVVGSVDFYPKQIDLGVVRPGSIVERRVSFKSIDGSTVCPLSARPRGFPGVSVEFSAEAQSMHADTKVCVDSDAKNGRISGVIEFLREGTDEKVAEIPVKGLIW